MAQEDYYEILGMKPTATDDEIRKAYRRLAKKYHPDLNKNDKASERKFKEITKAYEVLGDKDKRAQYEQFRAMGTQGFGGPGFDAFQKFGGARPGAAQGAGTGGKVRFEDLGGFGDLFKDFFDFGKRARAQEYQPQQGEDVYLRIEIPFETSIRGGKTVVRVPEEQTCPTCRGAGAQPGTKTGKCPACGGRGSLEESQGGFALSRPCPNCYGRGKIIESPCVTCRGSGMVRQRKTIAVRIPQGVESGTKIKVRGSGKPGIAGGPHGNLYLRIHVMPHGKFSRKGDDIYTECELNLAQAILGTKIEVETLEGRIKLRIPPGTQPGSKLRVKGHGVAYDGRTGDLYVVVKVQLPEKLTSAQREALLKFAQAAGLSE